MNWKTIAIAPAPHDLTASVHDHRWGEIVNYPVVAMLVQAHIDDEHTTRVVLGVLDPDTGMVFAIDQMPGVDSVIYVNTTATGERVQPS